MILTQKEKPNLNLYHCLPEAPAKLLSTIQLCPTTSPTSAPQPCPPQPLLLPGKSEWCVPWSWWIDKDTWVSFIPRTTWQNHKVKFALRLYQGKPGSAETLSFFLIFSEPVLGGHVLCSICLVASSHIQSPLHFLDTASWSDSKICSMHFWLPVCGTAEVRFPKLITVSWKNVALILNANYWNVQLVIHIF